jgi:hypothetical protein
MKDSIIIPCCKSNKFKPEHKKFEQAELLTNHTDMTTNETHHLLQSKHTSCVHSAAAFPATS